MRPTNGNEKNHYEFSKVPQIIVLLLQLWPWLTSSGRSSQSFFSQVVKAKIISGAAWTLKSFITAITTFQWPKWFFPLRKMVRSSVIRIERSQLRCLGSGLRDASLRRCFRHAQPGQGLGADPGHSAETVSSSWPGNALGWPQKSWWRRALLRLKSGLPFFKDSTWTLDQCESHVQTTWSEL